MPLTDLTEQDLEGLIMDKLGSCEGYSNICQLLQTPAGKQRIVTRVKELIFDDGITDIEASLAQIESELIFS